MPSASGLTTPLKWRHDLPFANPSQSSVNNLAIPFQDITRCWGLAWPDNSALPIRRGRLWWAHIPTGRSPLGGLHYEAAQVILTRSSAESDLRNWGLKLRERLGFKRAAVAVARKLAVTLHAMLKTGTAFNRAIDAKVTQ
jgi:hypothetical protein